MGPGKPKPPPKRQKRRVGGRTSPGKKDRGGGRRGRETNDPLAPLPHFVSRSLARADHQRGGGPEDGDHAPRGAGREEPRGARSTSRSRISHQDGFPFGSKEKGAKNQAKGVPGSDGLGANQKGFQHKRHFQISDFGRNLEAWHFLAVCCFLFRCSLGCEEPCRFLINSPCQVFTLKRALEARDNEAGATQGFRGKRASSMGGMGLETKESRPGGVFLPPSTPS